MTASDNDQSALEARWLKRLERERRARKEAESILDAKSLELYETNKHLQNLTKDLEKIVHERTLALTHALEVANQATHAKSDFLATMSHEIRTPLNGVLGMTELLGSTALTSEQNQYVETLTSCGKTLLSLISDILDMSKIEAGRLELEYITFEPQQLINDLVYLFHPQIKTDELVFSLEIDPALPPYLLGDPTRLRQVFFNLLSNALKFTSSGEITLCWKKDTTSPDHWKAYVKDTGIGISQSDQKNLFTSFSQVDSSISRRFGGSGLGLSICRHLCDAMQGHLWLESEVGEGSTFFFTFYAPVPTIFDSAESPLMISDHSYTNLRVLLVEDNHINQMIALKLLQKMGIQACLAENGAAAIEQMHQAIFDLVLMDIQMPVMDGITATRVIRNTDGFQQPIIVALTANAFSEDREKCLESGMNGFLTKPISLKNLREEIGRHFNHTVD